MKRNIIILQMHVSMYSDLLLVLTFEAALKEMKGWEGGVKPPKKFCRHLNDYIMYIYL